MAHKEQKHAPAAEPIRQPKTGRNLAVSAFVAWASSNERYSKQWAACSKAGKEVATAGLLGMRTLTPFAWNHWWALNHMSHTGVTGKEQRLINEILAVWLGEIASGRSKITQQTTTR